MNYFFFKENRLNFLTFIIAFFWLLIGSLFFMIPLYVIGPRVSGLPLSEYIQNMEIVTQHTYIIGCIAHTFGITIFGIMFYKYVLEDLIKFKNNLLLSILAIVISFGLMVGMAKLLEIIYEALGVEGTSQNQQGIIDALNGDYKGFVIFFVVILAPLFEEIVFRKLFYNTLKMNTRLPVWAIVLIISIAFAGIHVVGDLESLKFFPQYFILALILTSSYAISKENIFVSVGLHALNNIFSVLEILL